ncbi:MAG: hypothetical protein ACR2MO_06675 [Acidimicrobiales bacterium]
MVEDPQLRRRLGQRGAEHARSRYSLATAVGDMAIQYRAFLAGDAPVPDVAGRLAYGEEPGGLLLTGPIEEQGHPAHGVVSGRPARPLALKQLGEDPGTLLGIGASRAYLSLVAAKGGGRCRIVDLGLGREEADLAIWLNDLEDRVRVVVPEDENGGDRRIVLDITREPAALSWLEAHQDLLGEGVAAVLLEGAVGHQARDLLRRAGYSGVRLPGEAVYLHRSVRDLQALSRLWVAAAGVVASDMAGAGRALSVKVVERPRAALRGPLRARLPDVKRHR